VTKKKPPRSPRPAPAMQPFCVQLDARMTILQAAPLHSSLLTHLAAGRPIAIDGARVEEIDTAILQLLASLWRTARERGFACSWTGVSDGLRRTANLVGMTEMLHFPPSGLIGR
jgi:anti-anti-sigma regulatory factor